MIYMSSRKKSNSIGCSHSVIGKQQRVPGDGDDLSVQKVVIIVLVSIAAVIAAIVYLNISSPVIVQPKTIGDLLGEPVPKTIFFKTEGKMVKVTDRQQIEMISKLLFNQRIKQIPGIAKCGEMNFYWGNKNNELLLNFDGSVQVIKPRLFSNSGLGPCVYISQPSKQVHDVITDIAKSRPKH